MSPKHFLLLLATGGIAALFAPRGECASLDLIVHEWGTFTAVSGANGVLLSGLEVEEHALPTFVLSHAGFAPSALKGWPRPISGVTIKMETPVLYFYTAATAPLGVRVEVGFRGGSISQWYPERVGGEQLAALPAPGKATLAPIDFAAGYAGSAAWKVDVLPRAGAPAFTALRQFETPQWPRARVPAANRVRGPRGEVEGFIFYRGVGNFALPLRIRAEAGGRLVAENTGAEPIANVVVFEQREDRTPPRISVGRLAAGETTMLAPTVPTTGLAEVETALRDALIPAGLNREEADALLATWRESYFERPGLRVFWIVPRGFTDAILPLAISPQPARLERVLVGRTEVLTPEFEARLQRDFAADGGRRWEGDRYFRAYRERVRALGGAVGVAPVAATP